MTTDLQVRTVTLTPAVVEFNFEELSAVLDEKLKQYEGLEFTEKEAAACKKTITELNKGKKALNEYRLATKKELTISVTEFEGQCNELAQKFDDVIGPLKEQADEFEENRRDVKRKKVQIIVDDLIEKEGLNDKYAAQLVIEDKYLNKSTTLKSIMEELTTKAEHLGISQDKDEADVEVIKGYVSLINVKHGLNLIDSSYINLLDYQTVDEIKMRINNDVQHELVKDAPKKVEIVSPTPPVETDDEVYVEKYEVTGTESQLDALEEYMSSQGLTWVSVTDA